jgi:sec-independent protein translocase protein TatA
VLTDILQPTHLLLVLVVALLVLGPKRLPDAGRALGQGLREFKSSISGEPVRDDAEERAALTGAERGDAPTANAADREHAAV